MRKATGWAERNQEHWRREEEKGDELRTEYWVGDNVCSLGPERTGQDSTTQNVVFWPLPGLLEAQFRRWEITSRLSDPGRQQGNSKTKTAASSSGSSAAKVSINQRSKLR